MNKITTKNTIEDTGERMVPAYHKTKLVYGEHIVRYEALKDIVKDKIVLDIASGSGYGSQAIARYASKVYGVDVNGEAVKYAQDNYGADNIVFTEGDGVKIPLETNSLDVVVSFETIEHIEDYRQFISEVKRVLKKDGLFVLSTPNDIEFPEGAHFHIHEFERQELTHLISKFFMQTKEYFQATWLYNALLSEDLLTTEWTKQVQTINAAPLTHQKAIYFYMLCANRPITEVITPISAISEHFSERKVLEQNKEMEKYIKETILHFEGILEAKEKQLTDLRNANNTLKKILEDIHNSRIRRYIHKASTIKKSFKKDKTKNDQ